MGVFQIDFPVDKPTHDSHPLMLGRIGSKNPQQLRNLDQIGKAAGRHRERGRPKAKVKMFSQITSLILVTFKVA